MRVRGRLVPVALACGLAVLTSDSLGGASRAGAASAGSLRIANYEIDARLDTATRTVSGRAIITWTNRSGPAVSELRFHLYYNAWRNERSSFLRAAQRGPRPIRARDYGPDDWAYIDVHGIRLLSNGPAEVALPSRYVQPNDGNPDDRTVLEVALPGPVQPGDTIRVALDWTTKVPRPFQRVGVIGDYYLVGHWFPKIGVLQVDGRWNTHQFIQTEFFADFGTYDVRLTVPDGWIVGATGRRVSAETSADGSVSHHFRAEDVHDFAWTASPSFIVVTDRFVHEAFPPVDIELLLRPDHAGLADRYLSSAKAALEHFGSWLRPYPWDRLTIVDPPWDSQTGGMEYPMFVTGEGRWLTLPDNRLTEANTLHEIGHLWFQSAVANNEFEDAWLDESVTTYIHRRLLQQLYGPAHLERRYFRGFIPVAYRDVPRAPPTHGADPYDSLRPAIALDVLSTPSWRQDERVYFTLPYVKGALMLVTLERYLGWDTWRRVLATYADRFWLRHVTPEEFFAVVTEVSGQDLTWFFDQTYRGSGLFDYAVDRVMTTPVREPRGYAGDASPSAWSAGGGAPAAYESLVDIRRWGTATFPVEVRVTFEDGSVADERWDGETLWTRFRYVGPRVQTVEVDPRRVLVLDVNSGNNSWTRQPEATAAAVKWTGKWLIWLQTLLELSAFFA